MSRLSLNNRVLYIEYQASPFHVFWPLVRKRIFRFFGSLSKANNNLFVYGPPLLLLPFGYYLRWINKINQAIMSYFISRQIKKLGFKNDILWIYPPSAADLIKYIKPRVIVYHCIADFSCEKKNRFRRHTISVLEEEILSRANVVLAMTEGLHKRLIRINPNTFHFPSAVDFEYSYQKVREKSEIPQDLKSIKRPILGIVGYLDGKIIDLELLGYLSSQRPYWSLVLIGPIFKNKLLLQQMQDKKNIYFLGSKKHHDLPLYIKFFDVCLIPYKKTEFTQNVSPLKLYHYLACGKPVVSSAFSDLSKYADIIGIAQTKEEFLKEIEKALSQDNPEIVSKRFNLARQNSWDARINLIEKVMNNY